MKRTTYIMAGMLLAGLVVIACIMFYVPTLGSSKDDTILEIGGAQKTVQLPECKVIQLSTVSTRVKKVKDGIVEIARELSFKDVPLLIQPTDSSAKGSFSLADGMERFMTMTSNNDTLRIVFDFTKDELDEQFRQTQWLELHSAGMILKIPASVQLVRSNINSMNSTFKGFSSDTLSFDMRGVTVVEDCRFSALNVKGRTLQLKSGEVHDLYLDLDGIAHWEVNIESFHIDTEHLSGSDNHRCTVQKGECRQVLWTPKSEDASLNLKLTQAAKVEVE